MLADQLCYSAPTDFLSSGRPSKSLCFFIEYYPKFVLFQDPRYTVCTPGLFQKRAIHTAGEILSNFQPPKNARKYEKQGDWQKITKMENLLTSCFKNLSLPSAS